MKYFGENSKYYLQAVLTSTFIVIPICYLAYKENMSIYVLIFAAGWMFLDFREAYRKTEIPAIVTNEEGIMINFTLIDKKLIKWDDIISLKKGLLVKYKIVHKNGVKVLPIGNLNKKNRDALLKEIEQNIKQNNIC